MSVVVSGRTEIDAPENRISDTGTISLPLVGEVAVGGMTLQEAGAQLAENYKQYFINPRVNIDFSANQGHSAVSPWGYVNVQGRVRNPGFISIPPTRDLTVSQAIQLAGGPDTSAKLSSVRVTRPLKSGKSEAFTVDLRAASRVDENMQLNAGDVVYVPEQIF